MRIAAAGGTPLVVDATRDLTTSEAADILGVSREWVAQLADRGEIDSYRVGTHRRLPVKAVLDHRDRSASDTSPSTIEEVRRHRRAIASAINRAGGSGGPRIFGSFARGEATSSSDVDLLIDLGPRTSLVVLAELESTLTEIVGRPVDVLPVRTAERSDHLRHVIDESVPL